ncbi:MAG TPA: IclR family transcriptional regulator [Streptosporangiaceae bacterium]|jgi:DNA-binding IclR family transcriptional regulator
MNNDEERTSNRGETSSPSEETKGGKRGSGGAALVQSVDRAVSVLELLARHGEIGVTEIADLLGVHKSTAFRLLGALENRGLVEQPGVRGKYRLGFGVVRLAGAMTSRLDLTQQSQPVCEQLAAELGETVNVAVSGDGVVVNIQQVRGSSAVVTQNWVGRRTPMHATSNGKVLLAYMPFIELNQLLQDGLERFTPNTVTEPKALRAQLREIREIGYGTAIEELEIGLNAVAAPIYSMNGDVVATVSVSGPSYRLAEDAIPDAGESVMKAGREISERMGYVGEE